MNADADDSYVYSSKNDQEIYVEEVHLDDGKMEKERVKVSV